MTQLVLELQIGEFFEKWVIQVLEVWRTGQAFQAGKGSSAVLLLLVLDFLLFGFVVIVFAELIVFFGPRK